MSEHDEKSDDAGSPAATPMARKLGIREDTRVLLLDPPVGFARKLEPLPPGAGVGTRPYGQADLIALFASSQAVLAELFDKAAKAMAPRARIWACWPRKSSGVFTDLSEDAVRRAGLERGLSDDKLLALDDSWMALRFVFKERPRLQRPASVEKDERATS